ncbi:MAG: 2'-5' RNA ligase family protein [Bacteroidetes bacterium]|nr:2'-5' RNA ligase family protein [Bacteroidota bacterium]
MVNRTEYSNVISTQPLILTLGINEEAQHYFDNLRYRHFPPERNFLKAHLTLFHLLPDEPGIYDDLNVMAEKQPIFSLQAERIVSIGRGTAIKIKSQELMSLHRALQDCWSGFLSAQDKQKLWAHITIQNKVSPEKALELQALLNTGFKPFRFRASGLRLWRYLGGPWEELAFFKF